MSAPLVVNTTDGTVWVLRTVTREGLALYAVAGACDCPSYLLATLAELAERGIVGSADVLPVPVSTGPQAQGSAERAKVAELIGDAKPATTSLLEQLAQSVRDRLAHDHSTQREDWYCMNLTSFMGERMGPVLRRLLNAEARVAELEAERHSTNEALSDAAETLRANRDRIAKLEAELRIGAPWKCPVCSKENTRDVCVICETDRPDDAEADGITRRIAPTQALREAEPHAFVPEYQGESDAKRRLPNCKVCGRPATDTAHDEDVTPQVQKLRALLAGQRAALEDPHDSPLHHDYRLGRDLPQTGGAS